ncbi:sulfatase [Xenorhabdus sp. Reich]|uniref:Sulfatase n=1 Tax=Xenorhabdus littoralis TaxID=2582835 RepID=A0ABU4SKF0_9GAMM|nr:sulfatase [Xenorhabdus sp. psl]MDX7999064.1 sulfatase [Xenorhabdus sp. Reich]
MVFGLPLAFWHYKSFTWGQLLAILAVITTIILYLAIISEYYIDH